MGVESCDRCGNTDADNFYDCDNCQRHLCENCYGDTTLTACKSCIKDPDGKTIAEQSRPKEERILNVYGQEAWHTEARIVASRDALEALKKAIDRAIYYGYAEMRGDIGNPLYSSDGEGYDLQITCLGGWNDKRWKKHRPIYNIILEGAARDNKEVKE